jgi:ABC-2 type transport system ATP-binding protein
MLDAPVIILDEATTGMDPLMKRRVMDRLRAEARQGRTILLTTQVLSEAEELCESIMILDRGRSMASGTLRELRKLSTNLFRVNLTFADTNGDLVSKLEALEPIQLQVDGNTVEMVFQGEEASLLGRLADISRDTPILQFEVRGPTLEEIFITLMKETR